MANYVNDIFSTDVAAVTQAMKSFVAAIRSNNSEVARCAIEDVDERGNELVDFLSHGANKSEVLKQLGACWAIPIWRGIGQYFRQDKFVGLVKAASKGMRPSQMGLISSCKILTILCGNNFFVAFRDRGIHLPASPPKNLVEKLAAVLQRRSLVASITNDSPISQETLMDGFAYSFQEWLTTELSSDELDGYHDGHYYITTSDLIAYQAHMLEATNSQSTKIPQL
jgi:hypothetical protein